MKVHKLYTTMSHTHKRNLGIIFNMELSAFPISKVEKLSGTGDICIYEFIK